MKKRYQIFVSSTFVDLEEERGKVMQTILNFDCFPAGMELFPAMDEEQFEYIKRIIDDSDYYLLIIGGRYGDEDEKGVSWTEKEYDYAVSKHIPVIAFILEEKAYDQLPQNKTDQKDIDKKREKLKTFKTKVKKGRLVKFWTNVDDLDAAVAKSLPIVKEQQMRTGWVRADSIASDEAQARITRLEKDIAGYKEDLKKLEADLKKKAEECDSLDKFNKGAQQEIKNLQETMNQLHQKCDALKAQKEQWQENRLVVEQSYQEKVNEVAGDLEKVLEKLKGKQIETIQVPGTNVSFKMVRVEGGTFVMGANNDDEAAWDNEKPAHQVTLSDYYIGETQVTQALWRAVMGKNPSLFKGDLNRPVESVSWDDCQIFIEKLNALTGMSFCLPTEAQWEFAARGGNKSKGYQYAGGDDIVKVAWYEDNSKEKTHHFAQKDANELGIYDMSGNVWEWCQDWYGDYANTKQTNPKGPTKGSDRVSRGGGWFNTARNCRVSVRNYKEPTATNQNRGLRLALYFAGV